MVPEKEGGRTRRKRSAEQGESESKGKEQAIEKDAPEAPLTMVNVDPWSSFFERFWEQAAEGESTNLDGGERKPAKGTKMTDTKPRRQGRSSRAS